MLSDPLKAVKISCHSSRHCGWLKIRRVGLKSEVENILKAVKTIC